MFFNQPPFAHQGGTKPLAVYDNPVRDGIPMTHVFLNLLMSVILSAAASSCNFVMCCNRNDGGVDRLMLISGLNGLPYLCLALDNFWGLLRLVGAGPFVGVSVSVLDDLSGCFEELSFICIVS